VTAAETAERRLEVILFSGGRGSGALTRQLVRTPHVALTIAINGYDDGASTGEVRRFLGDCLGPSDFRKTASRLATELDTCPPALIDLLDSRLPADAADDRAIALVRARRRSEFPAAVRRLNASSANCSDTPNRFISPTAAWVTVCLAAAPLRARDFNSAVDDYCALLGLPAGLIENVTSGTNAWLVALDVDGRLLATEEAIVDGTRPNRIREIFLIDRSLTEDEARTPDVESRLAARRAPVSLNPRLAQKIAAADLIIYAPGTQHSSLFPSYLTSGLSAAIAANLTAIAAADQHPAGCGDQRQQRRGDHRSRGLLPEGEGTTDDSDAMPDYALSGQRSRVSRARRAVCAARAARDDRGSPSGPYRQLRGRHHRPA
jgi:2-phospho-L-lactate transferase/gluconeogenesis factor (CofD/UPF0052 family)